MKFRKLILDKAYVIEPNSIKDKRGSFSRIFCENELSEIEFLERIVQINHSVTKEKGIVRGMHFQYPPKAETKMVKCINGAVFDVIVDLRKGSPTFLQWHGEELTKENMKMIYIPKGFAHGFQTLIPNTELIYFHSEFYSKDYEGGINILDSKLNINWPLDISKVSDRDNKHSMLDKKFEGLEL